MTWNVGQTPKKPGTFDVDVEIKQTVTVRLDAESRNAAATEAAAIALARKKGDDRIRVQGDPVANAIETREAGW